MDNFKITKTILENIKEQNNRINECVDIVNGYTTDEATRVNQELQRQQKEVERQEQYNNNESKFSLINGKIDNIEKHIDGRFTQINLIEGMPNIYNFSTEDYYPMWEELLNDPRMSREVLGKDQSDTYDIYLYKYEPTNYNSTLFVTCAIHGWEHFSTYCMLQVFKILLNDKDLPTQFLNLSNTRILCIPVANPWGMNNNPSGGFVQSRRCNVNGVDLNRNFDYRWEYASVNNTFGLSKGTSPFSEKETQYIRDVFNRYNINHFTDLHAFEYRESEKNDMVIYGNERARANTQQYINWYKSVYDVKIAHTTTETDSTSNNYANQVMGIPSMNLELQRKRFAINGNIDIDCTRWTEHVINYLNFQSQSHFNKPNVEKNGVMIQSERVNRSSSLWEIPTSWTPIPEMSKEIEIKEDGILIISGWFTLKVETPGTAKITYDPVISQKYKPKGVSLRNRQYLTTSSITSMVQNFSVMTYCEGGQGNAAFNLNIIKEGTGTAYIDRQDCFYAFIPCKVGTIILPQHSL